jgi:PP-loop superfamily ATP-utilizing enzyme
LDDMLKQIGFKFISVDAAGYKPGKLVMIDND